MNVLEIYNIYQLHLEYHIVITYHVAVHTYCLLNNYILKRPSEEKSISNFAVMLVWHSELH